MALRSASDREGFSPMLAHAVSLTFVLAVSSGAPTTATSGTVVDRSPIVEELLDRFDDSMRNRTRGRGRDAETALGGLAALLERFEVAGPRDRSSIVRSVARGAERFDLVDPDEREVVLAAVAALSHMGPESVEPLLHFVVDGRIEADREVHRRTVLALGRTRDEAATGRLLRLLHHEDPVIQAAAAEGLGEYGGLEQERRKELFYKLLGRLLDAADAVEQDEFDTVARRRYDTVVGALTTSLQRLSGHDERDPHRWQRFWNKTKREDWDRTRS